MASGRHTWIGRGGVMALAALAVLALPSAAAAGDGQGARLSNERTSTLWAHPAGSAAAIRSAPAAKARQITKTHAYTEDGYPEVYLVLRSRTNSSGREWYKIRIPMRPNGLKGWVRDSALGPIERVGTQLVLDRSSQHATLYRRGKRIWSEPVGIGAPSTPTPAGHFWIREKFRTGNPSGLYGPVAFGTSNYSVLSDWPGGGVVGIHGTNEPSLIPGRPSHGCIRVKNDAVLRLWRLLPVGTPLEIR